MNKVDYGIFQYLISLFYIFLVFENFTHGNILKQYILKDEKKEEYISSFLFLSFVFSLLVSFVSLYYFRNQPYFHLWKYFVIALILRSFTPIFHYFDSQLLSRYGSISQLSGSFLYNVLRLIKPDNILFQSQLFVSQILITTIIGIYFYLFKLKSKILFKLPCTSMIKSIFKDSFPFLVIVLLWQLLQRVDMLFLEYFLGFDNLANYSVAVKLSEPWTFLSASIVVSIFPKVIGKRSLNNKVSDIFDLVNKLLLVISIFIVFVTYFLSDIIVNIFFDQKYIISSFYLRIYILSVPLLFLHGAQQVWEQREGLMNFTIFRCFIAFVVNVVLNYILVHRYEVLGVIYSSVFSYFILSIGCNFLTKKGRKYLVKQFKWSGTRHYVELGKDIL